MAGSSNHCFGTQQPPCPHFDGQNYDFWCVKMKTQLILNDVWEYVEDGYDDLGNVDNLTNEQKKQLKKHKRKDARALSMIQQGVSDNIFPKIINETKAKGAWDILQHEYGRKFWYSPTTQDPSQHSNNPMHPSLYKAVKDGKVEDLDQYTDLFDTQLTPNHNTILHVAAHFGKLECVATILDKKPCLLRQVNANFENPLHIAVRERHYDVVQVLIEHARKLDLEPESGAGTRLEILRAINVDGDTALHLAVREEHNEIVWLLVQEDLDFQHPPNRAEETPLYLATERKRGGFMVESILASNVLPAYTGPSGRTALHTAAIFENTDIMKMLLERYEELIDKADTEGWTPLHYAARCNGDPSLVREILKKNKSVGYARTSEKHDESTALHIVAAADLTLVMEEILSHCLDCWEMVNSKGRNILHIAMDAGAEGIIRYIKEKEGLQSLINQKDFEGNTPLHLHASSEMKFVFRGIEVVHPRANIYAFNNQNKTPSEVALAIALSANKGLIFPYANAAGGRNIAKEEALKNTRKILLEEYRRETEKETKEKNKEARVKKAEALKKTSESHMLVATLIATITFAASFAIPGGYDGNQGPKQGMAVLVREASFKAFVIANTIAVMCSTSSVVYYVFAAFYYFNVKDQGQRHAKGFYLVLIAIVAMTVSFISGTYAMLVHSLGLAIATSIIASITFLIYFLELCSLVPLWRSGQRSRRRALPWQLP